MPGFLVEKRINRKEIDACKGNSTDAKLAAFLTGKNWVESKGTTLSVNVKREAEDRFTADVLVTVVNDQRYLLTYLIKRNGEEFIAEHVASMGLGNVSE